MNMPAATPHSNDFFSTLLETASPGIRKEADIISSLQSTRLYFFAREIYFFIESISSLQDKHHLQSLMKQLPVEAVDRLLRSPAVSGILRLNKNVQELIHIMEVELLNNHDQDDYAYEGWSAMGDTWVGKGLPVQDLPLQTADGRFRSPSLLCGLSLDYSLPVWIEHPNAGLRSPAMPGKKELEETMDFIDSATMQLERLSPLGYHALQNLVSNIVIRNDLDRAAEAWGATSGAVVGRIVLVNPLASKEVFFLGELILHEVVHVAFDCLELDAPFYKNFNVFLPDVVVSPWTNNRLSVHALIHACLVWAVLLQYWSNVRKAEPSNKLALNRILYIKKGFENMKPDQMKEFSYDLSDNAFEVLEKACSLSELVGEVV